MSASSEIGAVLRRPDLFAQKAWIDGSWVGSADARVIEVFNPATDAVIGTVPRLSASEVAEAIVAADNAWARWRAVPAGERADILYRWYGLMMEHQDDLANILTLEQGKPLAEARGEIAYGAGFVRWFAEEARRIDGDVISSPGGDRRILALKEPVGVCVAITPWNFPNAMITRKCAPALAAGCTMVVKPSDLTPFSALAIARLGSEAGIPDGVLNVVTGLPEEIGAELTDNAAVRKLSFTGSTKVGKHLLRRCAEGVKRVSLELGGNAPFIVFEDADIALAVEGLMASKFRNGGQTCVCANRVLVHDAIHDRFVAELAARTAALKLGDGLAPGTTLGPLINADAVAKVGRHIEDALAKGARAVLGNRPAQGNFVAPTILTDARPDMLFAVEETFGPMAPVIRFSDTEEAIAIANGTPYGLASYFYTRDMKRAWAVAEAMEAGMVGLNTGSVSLEASPFGGVKQSGLGREGSKYGIAEYLEIKAFHIGDV